MGRTAGQFRAAAGCAPCRVHEVPPAITTHTPTHPLFPALAQEFRERHGMRGCMVAPTKIIAGLGMSLGIDVLDAPGTTGDYRTLFHR